jgi:hypothetical protein
VWWLYEGGRLCVVEVGDYQGTAYRVEGYERERERESMQESPRYESVKEFKRNELPTRFANDLLIFTL